MKPEPIRRHPLLQPLSREHHDGLLLSWKIRKGLQKNIDAARILTYVQWFWEHHLEPHFRQEEELLFPLLPADHRMVRTALGQHSSIRERIIESVTDSSALPVLADEVEEHIRFEERVLFNEIQKSVPEKSLELLHPSGDLHACPSWKDEFWK